MTRATLESFHRVALLWWDRVGRAKYNRALNEHTTIWKQLRLAGSSPAPGKAPGLELIPPPITHSPEHHRDRELQESRPAAGREDTNRDVRREPIPTAPPATNGKADPADRDA
jgi:hypothetical protein